MRSFPVLSLEIGIPNHNRSLFQRRFGVHNRTPIYVPRSSKKLISLRGDFSPFTHGVDFSRGDSKTLPLTTSIRPIPIPDPQFIDSVSNGARALASVKISTRAQFHRKDVGAGKRGIFKNNSHILSPYSAIFQLFGKSFLLSENAYRPTRGDRIHGHMREIHRRSPPADWDWFKLGFFRRKGDCSFSRAKRRFTSEIPHF